MSEHHIPQEQRREEKKEDSLYNIYNITNQEDTKVLRSCYVSKLLWDSSKKFAHFSECSLSCLLEKALMEFMVKHSAELPVNATFDLIPITPKDDPALDIEVSMYLERLKYLVLKHEALNNQSYYDSIKKILPKCLRLARKSRNEELLELVKKAKELLLSPLKLKFPECAKCNRCRYKTEPLFAVPEYCPEKQVLLQKQKEKAAAEDDLTPEEREGFNRAMEEIRRKAEAKKDAGV